MKQNMEKKCQIYLSVFSTFQVKCNLKKELAAEVINTK